MKQYFRGIAWGFILIGVSIITLILNVCIGPKQGRGFFDGFMKGSGLLEDNN